MRVLLVGDTHGNVSWLQEIVLPTGVALGVDAFCQLGDFGAWSETDSFLDAARRSPVPFFFLDGNHENHEVLARLTQGVRSPVSFGGNLVYLPRATSLTWDGVRVGFLGGAVSIDRGYRTPGYDWFAAEELSSGDVEAASTLAGCTVLFTHDAPAGFELPLAPVRDDVWLSALPACGRHRDTLAAVLGIVRPQLVVHGHYHRHWDREVAYPWGSCRVVGLNRDESDPSEHLALFECSGSAWSLTDVSSGL